MTEVIFKPQYDLRYRLALWAIGPFALLGLFALPGAVDDPMIFLWVGFLELCALVIWLNTFTEIAVGGRIVGRRFLLPPRVWDYADIKQVGLTLIMMRRGGQLQMTRYLNARELVELIGQRCPPQVWSDALAGGLALEQAHAFSAAAVAVPASFVLLLATAYFDIPPSGLPPAAGFFVIFLPLFTVAYLVLRRGRRSS